MAPKGQQDFSNRLKRINSPRNKSYYDRDLGMHVPKKISNETIRRNAKAKNTSLSAWFSSLIIGAVALIIAQAVRYRYFGMSEVSNATLFTDLLLTLLIVLTVSAVFRYRKVSYRFAQLLGAGAVLVAGHNLIWYYPDQLAVIYSDGYVQIVRETTLPRSLIFRDMTISL